MKLAGLLLVTVACAEPVVEMQLVLPKSADNFDTSCVTAVEVRVNGTTYPQVQDDRRKSCIDIAGGSSYAAIRDAIRGKFELAMPETGLTGIEIYGWSGPSPCKDDGDPFFSPDLLFFGNGDYLGQDRVDLPLVPNLSCARTSVKVRQVDMFAMIAGGTCAAASTIADGDGGAGLGTLTPRLYGKGSEFYGNLAGAQVIGNLSTFDGPTVVGPKSCLAIDGGSVNGGSTGCYVGGASVCASGGEYEHASLSNAVLANATNFDSATLVEFPGVIIGSVWTATKVPLAGATVSIVEGRGKVVYVDLPGANGALVARADQSATGPSGLFVLYADKLVSAKVSFGAAARTVTLGASSDLLAAAMVVLP